jgi:hypothetical protein
VELVEEDSIPSVPPPPTDTIQYIDWMIDGMISNPRNFRETPEELESMLWAYDDIRNQIVRQTDSSQIHYTYGNFLMTTECQAASYCARQRLEGRVPTMEGLCDHWRQFIAWRIWQNSLPLSERPVVRSRPPGEPNE